MNVCAGDSVWRGETVRNIHVEDLDSPAEGHSRIMKTYPNRQAGPGSLPVAAVVMTTDVTDMGNLALQVVPSRPLSATGRSASACAAAAGYS